MEKTLGVIGIGNPFRRDDAIGIILLDFLKKNEKKHLSNVTFIDGGTGGMNILHPLSDYKVVLLIDAVKFGGTPGQWKFFSYHEVISQKKQGHGLTHISDIFQIVILAKELNQIPKHLYIFGVEPEDTSYGQGLSGSITDNLDTLELCLKDKLHWVIDTLLLD